MHPSPRGKDSKGNFELKIFLKYIKIPEESRQEFIKFKEEDSIFHKKHSGLL